jgi:iron complex outermembrane receptor protein
MVPWNVDAGANTVVSKTWYRALARGHFANVGTALQGVSVVRADNIDFPSLTWTARDAAGATLNPYSLDNYRVLTATNDPVDGKATVRSAYVDLHCVTSTPGRFRSRSRPASTSAKKGATTAATPRPTRYLGADRTANTAGQCRHAVPRRHLFIGSNPGFGSPAIQWIDAYKLASLYKSNPEQFRLGTGTNQDGVEAETNRINNSEKDHRDDHRRLHPVRWQADEQQAAVCGPASASKRPRMKARVRLTNPDAVFQRNANGTMSTATWPRPVSSVSVARTRGTAGSLQELKLTRVERAYKASREYDGVYPSLHLTYNFTDNFLARFAYAKTIGRPDYANIIPNADINEDDTNPDAPGSITIRNTALQPWTADNFDLSLEYYFSKGGVFSVGAFQKDLTDFWTAARRGARCGARGRARPRSRYVGWTVSTLVNGGDASISGAEFNLVQPLSFLPGFGKYLTIKSNGTMIHLSGDKTPDFRGFISKSGNFSISYNRSPIVLNVNFNYRGRQKGTSITAPASPDRRAVWSHDGLL